MGILEIYKDAHAALEAPYKSGVTSKEKCEAQKRELVAAGPAGMHAIRPAQAGTLQ